MGKGEQKIDVAWMSLSGPTLISWMSFVLDDGSVCGIKRCEPSRSVMTGDYQ
jgi:hypothetical protein